MRLTIAAAGLIGLVSWTAQAAAQGAQHTVRTEIKRGWDESAACAGVPGVEASTTLACLQTAQDRNRQQMPQDFRYFEVGLYFNAWLHFNQLAAADRDSRLLGGYEKSSWTSYVVARREVGLADSSVIETVQPGDGMRARIAEAERKFGN
jgi:hypothetical protein